MLGIGAGLFSEDFLQSMRDYETPEGKAFREQREAKAAAEKAKYDANPAAYEANLAAIEKKRQQDEAQRIADKQAAEDKYNPEKQRQQRITSLLKELGKDEPAYRKIAEGLANQGIDSLKDIQYTKTPILENQLISLKPYGPIDESGYYNGVAGYYLGNQKVFDVNDPKIADLKAKGQFKENPRNDPETGSSWTDYYATLPTGEYTSSWTNKATGKPINNYRFGMLGNGEGGISGGDLFFNLTADKDGKVSIAPDWSPRRRSQLREIAFPVLALASLAFDWSGTTGAAILGLGEAAVGLELAGSIAAGITSATGVAVSAGAITAGIGTAALTTGMTYATTGDFESALKAGGTALVGSVVGAAAGGAAAGALPAGASAELTKFVTDAVTAGTSTAIRGGDASQILTNAFASGASAGVRDAATEVVGADVAKGLGAATASFIKTGDIEKAATTGLMSGFGSAAKGAFKDTDVTGGDAKQFSSAALEELKNIPDPNAESGIKSIDTRADENGLGKDLAVDTRADENGIGSLIPKDNVAEQPPAVVNTPVAESAPVSENTPVVENKEDTKDGIASLPPAETTAPVSTDTKTVAPEEVVAKDDGIKSLAPPNSNSEDAGIVRDDGLSSLSPKELQTVYDQENPGAANVDVETANTVTIDGKEYFLNNEGGAATQNPDGSYTNLTAEELAALGEPDEVESDATLDTVTVTGKDDTIDPVAYDDEGNLMPGYELDEDNNPVWVGDEYNYDDPEYSLDNDPNYVSPEGEGMVDDGGYEIDPYDPLELPPGADPDELPEEEPYLLNPDEDVPDEDTKLPRIPPIFPPKTPTSPTTKPPVETKPPVAKEDDTGLGDLTKTLIGGTVIGKAVSDLTKTDTKETAPKLADPLKGNYTFNWNALQTNAPEKGVAYGQRYFGNHWQSPAEQKAEEKQPQPQVSEIMPYAEGGLMSIGGEMFKPTMVDSGISAAQLSKDDITNQAIHHMRRGGHVIDHKTHKDVSYLAGKGEPVHHIVGFMNHRKRMAEGGITSHSLGSYSDGGHLLKGPGDGMSDDIPATIADKQPARLANEEFVIPADVVSHLGNGSSESGAKVLYEMMARIRKARTGNPKQGKQIDPHKLLPKV